MADCEINTGSSLALREMRSELFATPQRLFTVASHFLTVSPLCSKLVTLLS